MATMTRIQALAARAGDVMTYVHPATRAVRHHLIDAVELRAMDRIAGWKPAPKGALLKEPRLTKATGLALKPRPHPHEDNIGWVPVEDVLFCWRKVATAAPVCWRAA